MTADQVAALAGVDANLEGQDWQLGCNWQSADMLSFVGYNVIPATTLSEFGAQLGGGESATIAGLPGLVIRAEDSGFATVAVDLGASHVVVVQASLDGSPDDVLDAATAVMKALIPLVRG